MHVNLTYAIEWGVCRCCAFGFLYITLSSWEEVSDQIIKATIVVNFSPLRLHKLIPAHTLTELGTTLHFLRRAFIEEIIYK